MGQSLATQFLHSDLDIPCPACRYIMWVRWSEIVAQCVITCPCCRIDVRLTDGEGGMQTAGSAIEQQINQALKGLFG
ncbi:hypothetical protein [Streptosporangium sp. NPDC051022]|uniref:hypothetical protein n=1 Tax=Streptosporangium sp. NPDC051022 TaxID=3155752 RepID=UPI0034396808